MQRIVSQLGALGMLTIFPGIGGLAGGQRQGRINQLNIVHRSTRSAIGRFRRRKYRQKGRDRNRPCPCGSSAKFKFCCWA